MFLTFPFIDWRSSLLKLKKMQLLRWNNPGAKRQTSVSMARGAGCRELNPRLRRRRKMFLTFPFIDQAFTLKCPVAGKKSVIGMFQQ